MSNNVPDYQVLTYNAQNTGKTDSKSIADVAADIALFNHRVEIHASKLSSQFVIANSTAEQIIPFDQEIVTNANNNMVLNDDGSVTLQPGIYYVAYRINPLIYDAGNNNSNSNPLPPGPIGPIDPNDGVGPINTSVPDGPVNPLKSDRNLGNFLTTFVKYDTYLTIDDVINSSSITNSVVYYDPNRPEDIYHPISTNVTVHVEQESIMKIIIKRATSTPISNGGISAGGTCLTIHKLV